MKGIMSKLDELRNMGVESGPIGGPNNPESYPGQARERGNQTPVPREMLAGMGIESGPIGSPTNPESFPGQAGELMQDQAPEMLQQEQVIDTGQDAQMLADAVVKRSQGNPETALQILESAKGIIMNAIGGSAPRNMNLGGPMPMYADGGDIMGYADGNEISMDNLNPGLKALAKKDKNVVEKITGKTVKDMAGGGSMMPEYNLGGDIEQIEKMAVGGSLNELMKQRYG